MRTLPRSARVSPARMEISVVLPAPLGPRSPKNSPGATQRSTPASASTASKRRARPLMSTAGVTLEGADAPGASRDGTGKGVALAADTVTGAGRGCEQFVDAVHARKCQQRLGKPAQ